MPNQLQPGIRDVREYHERTKHRLNRYAEGPGYLDWESAPDPFRSFPGAGTIQLPLDAPEPDSPYGALFNMELAEPIVYGLESLSAFLRLSLALSAWKAHGESKWALRINPSSGNLHAEEAYIISAPAPGLEGGVYHYDSLRHALEKRRGGLGEESLPSGLFMIGLSSIHWREAWKYGERAYRYCQLDIGHAILCLRFAAAAMGWNARLIASVSDGAMASLMGIDREEDFISAEAESPEALVLVSTEGNIPEDEVGMLDQLCAIKAGPWSGKAGAASRIHSHEWPVIDQAVRLTQKPVTLERFFPPPSAPQLPASPVEKTAAHVIKSRRSGQAYDGTSVMTAHQLHRILSALIPRPGQPPWDMIPWPAMIHPVFFLHKVEGYRPGVYILVRRSGEEEALKQAMGHKYPWTRPSSAPDDLPLYLLKGMDARGTASMISCRQDIAGDGVFSLGLLARFADNLTAGPWWYKRLHWEAGAVGQALYLEAEAIGFRGTGIGCYYDDMFHSTIGVDGEAFADLYHFTVGAALEDARITTLPPYGL